MDVIHALREACANLLHGDVSIYISMVLVSLAIVWMKSGKLFTFSSVRSDKYTELTSVKDLKNGFKNVEEHLLHHLSDADAQARSHQLFEAALRKYGTERVLLEFDNAGEIETGRMLDAFRGMVGCRLSLWKQKYEFAKGSFSFVTGNIVGDDVVKHMTICMDRPAKLKNVIPPSDPCPLIQAIFTFSTYIPADFAPHIINVVKQWGVPRCIDERINEHKVLADGQEISVAYETDATSVKRTSSAVNWKELKPINPRMFELFKVHKGSVLEGTILTVHCQVGITTYLATEDDDIVRVAFYNQIPCAATSTPAIFLASKVFPAGAKVRIAEPFYKISNDGQRTVRVDSIEDVQITFDCPKDKMLLGVSEPLQYGEKFVKQGDSFSAHMLYHLAMRTPVPAIDLIFELLFERARVCYEDGDDSGAADVAAALFLRPKHSNARSLYDAFRKRQNGSSSEESNLAHAFKFHLNCIASTDPEIIYDADSKTIEQWLDHGKKCFKVGNTVKAYEAFTNGLTKSSNMCMLIMEAAVSSHDIELHNMALAACNCALAIMRCNGSILNVTEMYGLALSSLSKLGCHDAVNGILYLLMDKGNDQDEDTRSVFNEILTSFPRSFISDITMESKSDVVHSSLEICSEGRLVTKNNKTIPEGEVVVNQRPLVSYSIEAYPRLLQICDNLDGMGESKDVANLMMRDFKELVTRQVVETTGVIEKIYGPKGEVSVNDMYYGLFKRMHYLAVSDRVMSSIFGKMATFDIDQSPISSPRELLIHLDLNEEGPKTVPGAEFLRGVCCRNAIGDQYKRLDIVPLLNRIPATNHPNTIIDGNYKVVAKMNIGADSKIKRRRPTTKGPGRGMGLGILQ